MNVKDAKESQILLLCLLSTYAGQIEQHKSAFIGTIREWTYANVRRSPIVKKLDSLGSMGSKLRK